MIGITSTIREFFIDPKTLTGIALFFCHVVILCHVISAFGQFVETHDDVEANRAKIKYFTINQSDYSQGGDIKQSNNFRVR